ncbi:uncharacterized protein [Chelonus insularis]|uniref:uncharacterized protein n=1 Tax=Chelonus insularis TaxID=460826 RepID=UPI00158C79B6|nr:uncharacterized protein LOC118074451 [Chelonus insularis]
MRAEHVERRLDQQLSYAERIENAYEHLMSVGRGDVSRHRIESRLQALREEWGNFNVNNDAILMCIRKVEFPQRTVLEQHTYFINKVYNKTYQTYLDNVERMSNLLETTCETASTSSASQPTSVITHINSRLPRIDIRKYDGTFNNWLPFRDLFTSIVISNASISLVEKLQYLKISLTGPAAQFIKNISLTSENFQKAWDSLTSFYENDRLLVQSAVASLFAIKAMTKESASELEQLYSSTLQAYRTLETLNRPIHSWDDILVHLTVNRLDANLVRSWENYLGASKRPPTWDQLESFLKTKMVSLQSFEKIPKKLSGTNNSRQHHFKSHHSTSQESIGNSFSSKQQTCPCCSKPHPLTKCSQYASKTIKQRQEFIKSKKLCYNCLKYHFRSNCNSSHRCLKCGRKHHTSLHQFQDFNSSNKQVQSSTLVNQSNSTHTEEPSKQVNHLHKPLQVQAIVFLATAQVKILHENGTSLEVRALIDPGSEISLISEYVVQQLKLLRKSASIPIIGVGAKRTGSTRGLVNLKIKPHYESATIIACQAYVLPKLTSRIPSKTCHIPQWDHLKNLLLADPHYTKPGAIDLILGSDIYGSLLEGSIVKGPDNSPTAQLTQLGWIISGPSSINSDQREVTSNHCSLDKELYSLLENFWHQEEIISSKNKTLDPKEQECENHFIATHSRDDSGRYIVRLPFRTPVNQIGESKLSAIRMLNHLQRKFSSNPDFYQAYSSFLKEYKMLHHMNQVADDEPEPKVSFYLPHHGVIRESSITTKLRVVFNGSCQVTNGIPLNEALHAGPKLQINLFDILIWVRQFKFLFSADIEKMYRQVQVHKDDWPFQRILWKEEGKIIKFELTTVTYGLVCAPYLALRAVLQLIKDEGHQFPLAAEILLKGRYVDDVFGGADTIEEAQLKAKQTYDLCMAGGFPLRKWISNEPEVLKLIDSNYVINTQSISLKEQVVHTLGLSWKPALDTFQFKLLDASVTKFTKRSVLSKIAQFFDPLGLLSPIFIKAKIFMQELWVIKTGWDDPLNDSQVKSWKTFIDSLDELNHIEIPRWTGMMKNLSIEIHGFSDASQLAIAAVVYIKTYGLNTTQVTLLCSKTRVAPIKRMTIPRLELSAAVLLTKLVAQCRQVLNLNQAPCYLWTDSAIVHIWLNNHPSRWKEFVHNRVCLIQDLIPQAK